MQAYEFSRMLRAEMALLPGSNEQKLQIAQQARKFIDVILANDAPGVDQQTAIALARVQEPRLAEGYDAWLRSRGELS